MSLLKWNQKKVQNLTPWQIWMFILARVFMSFGVGVIAMKYWPNMIAWSGFPAILCWAVGP